MIFDFAKSKVCREIKKIIKQNQNKSKSKDKQDKSML